MCINRIIFIFTLAVSMFAYAHYTLSSEFGTLKENSVLESTNESLGEYIRSPKKDNYGIYEGIMEDSVETYHESQLKISDFPVK